MTTGAASRGNSRTRTEEERRGDFSLSRAERGMNMAKLLSRPGKTIKRHAEAMPGMALSDFI